MWRAHVATVINDNTGAAAVNTFHLFTQLIKVDISALVYFEFLTFFLIKGDETTSDEIDEGCLLFFG